MNDLTAFIADIFIKRLSATALEAKWRGKIRDDYYTGYMGARA
jgi:hypothetical protein